MIAQNSSNNFPQLIIHHLTMNRFDRCTLSTSTALNLRSVNNYLFIQALYTSLFCWCTHKPRRHDPAKNMENILHKFNFSLSYLFTCPCYHRTKVEVEKSGGVQCACCFRKISSLLVIILQMIKFTVRDSTSYTSRQRARSDLALFEFRARLIMKSAGINMERACIYENHIDIKI